MKQATILNRLIDYVGTTMNKPSPSFDPKYQENFQLMRQPYDPYCTLS
jgi:hypothetical protein